MIWEAIYLLCLLSFGSGILALASFRRFMSIPVGLLLGIASFVVAGFFLGITSLPISPRLIFLLFGLIGLVMWVSLFVKRLLPKRLIILSALSCVVICFSVVFFWKANLTKYHYDPFRYLMTASLFASENTDALTENLLSKRFSAVSIMHSPAYQTGEFYIRSITPLISITTLLLVAWLITESLRGKIATKLAWVYAALGVLLLITSRSYIWHTFYLNGHLLMGAFALALSTSAYLQAKSKSTSMAYAIIMCGSVVGAILTRPEAAVFTALAITPILLAPRIAVGTKQAVLASYGLALLLQQVFIVGGMSRIHEQAPSSAKALLLLAALSLMTIPLLHISLLVRNSELLQKLAELGPWLLLLPLFLNSPDILRESLVATYENVLLGGGGWGWSLVILAMLVVAVTVLNKDRLLAILRIPVTTFLPLAMLLPYARTGGAYRVGVTDSLNRMFMQILPLAVVYAVVGLALWHANTNSSPVAASKK